MESDEIYVMCVDSVSINYLRNKIYLLANIRILEAFFIYCGNQNSFQSKDEFESFYCSFLFP